MLRRLFNYIELGRYGKTSKSAYDSFDEFTGCFTDKLIK